MKIYYYMLVNKNNNPIVTGEKLPLYWNKKVAMSESIKFKALVKKIKIVELQKLITQH